ncbi:Uma2 family endonuclease [Paenibacillus sp. HJGM_3]|uniref:Uma2 family endonuclease n=1 Tax=Paenibacillus sp. HJGM_3 TaxID=3379816 RepID=UPI0038588AE7
MSMPLENRSYKYKDYLSWAEGERVELIHGHVYAMTPAPSRIHQEVLGALYVPFYQYLHGKSCSVYLAPFDVRLPKGNERDEDIDTIVQPDLSVICDPGKLDDRGCKGAPDLVIEIISPGSLKLDITIKKNLYDQTGVKEYWVVYPLEKIVMVYKRSDPKNKFDDGETYHKDASVPVGIFPDFAIELDQVFLAR